VTKIGQEGAFRPILGCAKPGRLSPRSSINSTIARILGQAQVTRPQLGGAILRERSNLHA
jgi:hypothetical protein